MFMMNNNFADSGLPYNYTPNGFTLPPDPVGGTAGNNNQGVPNGVPPSPWGSNANQGAPNDVPPSPWGKRHDPDRLKPENDSEIANALTGGGPWQAVSVNS